MKPLRVEINPYKESEHFCDHLRWDVINRLTYGLKNGMFGYPDRDKNSCRCAICMTGGYHYHFSLFGKSNFLNKQYLYMVHPNLNSFDYLPGLERYIKAKRRDMKKKTRFQSRFKWPAPKIERHLRDKVKLLAKISTGMITTLHHTSPLGVKDGCLICQNDMIYLYESVNLTTYISIIPQVNSVEQITKVIHSYYISHTTDLTGKY